MYMSLEFLQSCVASSPFCPNTQLKPCLREFYCITAWNQNCECYNIVKTNRLRTN
jgi:hypothetical protein